jgi:hypothetical protein
VQIRLLQNCIEDRHFANIQAGFEPLDFRHNPRPELREFQVFRELFERREHKRADILGAVSLRFQGKSLLDGEQVRGWIKENPGYDVYVVNPYPQFPYTHKNMWQFSENTRDKNFTANSQMVFDRVGVDFDLSNTGHQANNILSMCSYWFGTSAFWEAYMEGVVLPVLNADRSMLGEQLHNFLYQPQFYYGVATTRIGSLPFLLERSVSMFLAKSKGLRAKFYPASRERVLACCLFSFERELVSLYGDMIDGWVESGYQGEDLESYFDMASQLCGAGWRLHFKYHPISFEFCDPRPSLPWFQTHGIVDRFRSHCLSDPES